MKLLEVIEERPKKKIINEVRNQFGFTREPGVVQVSNNRWLFVADHADETLAFGYPTQEAAQAAMNEFTNDATDKAQWITDNESNRRTSRWTRAADAVDESNLTARANRARPGSWLARASGSLFWGPFMSLMRIAGPASGIYFGIVSAIADVQEEFEDGQISAEQRDEEIAVLYGMFYVEVGALILFIFRTARLARAAVNALRVITRVASTAVAATGVGIPAAAVSFIITEGAWWAFSYWITSARVQNALKDVIISWGASFLFEGIGNIGQGAMAALAEATDDRFGSRDARRWFGIPTDPNEQELRSAGYGSSEWAKLVMGAIMYPPSAEPIVVPYYPEERRQAFLAEKLNIDIEEPAPDDQPEDDGVTLDTDPQQAADAAIDRRMDGDAAATRNTTSEPTAEPVASGTPVPGDVTGFSAMSPEDILAQAQSGRGFGG